MKKLSIMAACLATVGLLAGCGSKFDASGYVKALMDNSYKNDSTQFVAMKIGTAEQASELYEQGIDTEMAGLTAAAGSAVTDEQAQGMRDAITDIFAGAKYTVGEAQKQDDNSYVVTITYEQMQVFGPTVESYMDAIEELTNNVTGEETQEELIAAVIDALQVSLEDAYANVTYAEPETTTIRVELIDNVYTPNQSDLYNLESVLFDTDALLNVG